MKKVWLAVGLSACLTACMDNETANAESKAAEASAQVAEKPVETPVPQAKEVAETPKAEEAAKAEESSAEVNKETLVADSKMAMKALGGQLKKELKAAMKAEGPVAALAVCNEKAPQIAASVSAEKGLQVSRVSLKNRNPDNAANEWQTAVLNDFETRKAAGESADKLFHAEVVEDHGQKQFRFMKAISTGKVCLTCHGETIGTDITAKLNELYPEDKATGFKEGDLRGAFVVITNLQ